MDHGRIDGGSLLLHYFALSLIPVYPPGRCSPWSTLTEAFPLALSLLERTKQLEGNVFVLPEVLKRKRKNRFKF